MGALIGLTLGVGLLTMWLSVATPAQALAIAPPTNSRAVLVPTATALATGFLAFVLTGLPIVALMAAVAGAYVPRLVRTRRWASGQARRRRAWPDVIDSLVSGVRAGLSLPEAVAGIGERGPECFREDFLAFAHDYRTTGRFSDSVCGLRDRLADPTADRICEALLVAREVGGTDLGVMLRTLGDFVRQDLRLRDEAEARRSWTVNGARLAVAAPWIVLVLLSTQAEVVDAYRTSMGMIVLTVGAAVCVLAYWFMTKVGKLPTEARLSP